MRQIFKLIAKLSLRVKENKRELYSVFSFWYFVCVSNIQVSFSAEIKVFFRGKLDFSTCLLKNLIIFLQAFYLLEKV